MMLILNLSVPLYCGPSIVNFSAGINYLYNRPDYADIYYAYRWLDQQGRLTNNTTTHELIKIVSKESDKLIAYRNQSDCIELLGSHSNRLNRNILVVTKDNIDLNAFCNGYAVAMCKVDKVSNFTYDRHKAQSLGYTQVIYFNNMKILKYEVF